VILLALLIVLVISAVWLLRDERRAQIDALNDLAIPLLVETRALTANRFSGRTRPIREDIVADIFVSQAVEMDLRILVVDPTGLVLLDTATDTAPDTGGHLTGQFLAAYAEPVARVIRAATESDTFVSHVATPSRNDTVSPFAGQIVLLAASGERLVGGGSPNALVLVEPPRRQGVVARFIPPLLLALACALLVAVVAGYGLSRRLAAPIARLTLAADAMAAGRLDQHIPAAGLDEIGRLVASFNAMSGRVTATDRAQRTLLADVSHELRTPLTNVQGYTQALRDGLLRTPQEIDAALSTISSESDRMTRLIGQLLDLARVESGQSPLTLRQTDLRRILESTHQRFASSAAEQGVTLTIEAPAPVTLLADEDRLAQILGNLVANALRHTPSGGEIALTAHARRFPSGQPTAAIVTVRDTGSGIPAERLPTVFDRFTRGDTDPSGFGLGLAIAKELAVLHGGVISVESELGGGTTFTIQLPLTTTNADSNS